MTTQRLLTRGTKDHYQDAALYDHEYRRRRDDVRFYQTLASQQGGPILELGCGTGRIALPLVKDGHEVLGLDLEHSMLERASQRRGRLARGVRPHLQLLQADLRDFALGRRYPLIISAFNTLMHLYRSDDVLAVFRRVRAHLAPGGLFAFDVLMPDLEWLLRDPDKRWVRRRFRHPQSGRWLIYSTNHDYDPVSQVCHVRIYYDPLPGEKGPSRVVHLAHRQFFPQELRVLIQAAGLRIERCEGDFGGRPLGAVSESQVYVCSVA